MDDALRRAALSRHGLVLRGEAAGLPAGERRALVVAQPRVLVAGTQPQDRATRVAAVELSAPQVVLAGRTAAWAHGLDVVDDGTVDVAAPDTEQLVLLPPARVRRLAPSLLTGVRSVRGHRVVSVETALVQCAERTDDLLDLVEQALRDRLTTPDRLRRRCGRGIAGSAALRVVVAELDAGADRLPRRLRSALEAAGVRGLESEVRVLSPDGACAWLDLLHRPSRTALEVDGWTAHGTRTAFLADRRRDRWVHRTHGLSTLRVTAWEVEQRLDDVVRELAPLLGARRPAG